MRYYQISSQLFSIIIISALFHLPNSINLTGMIPQLNQEFLFWKAKYSKDYATSSIHLYRLGVYTQNWVKVYEHNRRYTEGEVEYKLDLNKFADLTKQQWKQIYGQPNLSDQIKNTIKNVRKSVAQNNPSTTQCIGIINDAPNPPIQVDWTKRAVSKVSDQGDCGSNWAFTSTGAIQGLYALKRGKLISLSEQQMIDCSHDYGNEGCGGGFMDQVFWYVIDHGITSDELYPYKAVDSKCRYSPAMKVASFRQCARVPSGNYSKLLSAIIQQPTSVAVDASDFQLYSEGIYSGNCTDDIDQGMLLVGYGGGENSTLYWKLKNSIGTDWGMKGYILIERMETDGAGKCGIQLAASVPQIIT